MGVTIRTATVADLSGLVELAEERDAARYAAHHVRAALADLDPEMGRTWLAEVDGELAGTTSVVWRDLVGLGRAGYWTNLYVRPRFRARMVYPLLVRKMQAALGSDDIVCCYCAVRRPRVLEGHLKLQFERVAEYGVLARPLRPARLLRRSTEEREPTLRRLATKWATVAAWPLDALVVAGTRVWSRFGQVDEAAVDDLVPLMGGRPRGSVAWSSSELASRLRPAIDGEAYRIRRVGHDAALVWRQARRGRVAAAAILELAGSNPRATSLLLHAACSEAADAGADVALWLDGAPEHRSTLHKAGFFGTEERYSLIAWPPGRLDATALRFSFLDHDAF